MSRFANRIPAPILFYLVFLISEARSIPSYFVTLLGANRWKNLHTWIYVFLIFLLNAQEIAFPIYNYFDYETCPPKQRYSSSYYGPGAFLAWYLTAASICGKYLRKSSRQPSLSESKSSNALEVEPELVAVIAYAAVAFFDVLYHLIFLRFCFTLSSYAGYTVTSSVTDLALITFMICAVNHHSKFNMMIGTTLIISCSCHVILAIVLPFKFRHSWQWKDKVNVYLDQTILPVLQNGVLLAMTSPRVQPVALWKRLLVLVSYVSSSIITKLVQGTFLRGTGSNIGDLDQLAPLGTALLVSGFSWRKELSRLLRRLIRR